MEQIPWASLLSSRTSAESIRRAAGLARPPLPDAIELGTQQPSPDLIPHERIRECLDAVLSERGARSLGYSPGEGVAELRREIAKDLASRGVEARPEEVVVTSGSQQGLDLLARVLVDPGDAFLVENATYPGTTHLLASAGARIVPVETDDEGPSMGALAAAARERPKGLYLMPNFHNPLGTSISARRRAEIASWSRRAGVPLIEDDYDSDLRLDGVPSPPHLRALDPEVCHVGTYSKKLSPALRIGYLLAPRAIRDQVVAMKTDQDNGTSALLQHALAEFLARGHLKEHLARLLPAYRERRDALESALRAALP